MTDFKSLKNPELIQAYRLMEYDPTPERQAEFLQEVVDAQFMAPAAFSPEPEEDWEGTMTFSEDSTVTFPEIRNSGDEKYFPAFTDWKEMQKWEMQEGQHVVGLSFEDFASMIFQDKDATGFVINPFGESIKIDRDVITTLKQQQAAFLKRQQMIEERNHPERQPSNEPMEFCRLESYPEEMLEEITEFLKEQPVKLAYMQGVLQGERKGCMFILEHEGSEEDIFGGIIRLAKPYMSGMYLYMANADSELGQKALEGLDPFFRL